MKKILVILLLLVLLVIGGLAAMFVKSFNPTTFQNEVVASLQKLTGREVFVKGNTTVTWNPMPTVQITDVRLKNLDKSKNPNMLTIEKMKISIEWASLLKSPLVIKSIELTKPVLLLERLESNRSNFSFPFLLDPNFQLNSVDLMSGGQSAETKIDSIVMTGGSVRYDNQITGISLDVTDINGQLILDGVRGPFRFDGDGDINNKNYNLSLKTGVFQSSTPIDVSVDLKEKTAGAEFSLNGKMTPAQRDKWLTATGTFSIARLGAFAEGMGISIPATIVQKNASGSLSVEIEADKDVLKNFIVQLGEGDTAMGMSGTLTRHILGKIPSYEIDVGIDQINIDDWKELSSVFDWKWLTGENEYPEITLTAKVKSIPYRKGFLSDLVLGARYQKNDLSILDSTVVLPGETKISFSGMGKMVQNTPVLDLDINMKTGLPKELINWLLPKGTGLINIDPLQQGMLRGRLAIAPDKVSLSLNELQFNDSTMSGVIQRLQGEKESYVLKLALNNVNFDTYTGWKSSEEAIPVSELPLLIKKSFEQATWMNGLDVQAQIDVRDGVFFGLPVSLTRLEGKVVENVLKVDMLLLQNIAMADMLIQGKLNGVGRPSMNVDALSFQLKTSQLPLLFEKAKLTSSLPLIANASDAKVKVALNGGREGRWTMETQAVLSDANIKLLGNMESLETTPVFQDMSVDIAHPNFKTFMSLVAPGFDYFPNLDGTFKAKAVFSGTKNHFDLADAQIGVGLQQLSGSLSFDNKKIKTLVMDVTSPSIDLDRFIGDTNPFYSSMSGISKKAFDFSQLDKWAVSAKIKASQLLYGNMSIRQADIDFNLQNKEFHLTKFLGNTSNSDAAPFEMNGKMDWNTTPKLTLHFDMQKLPIRSDFMVFSDFAFGGGMLSVSGDLDTRGESPMAWAGNLNGQGKISVQGGQMVGVDAEGMIPIITRAIQRNEGPKIFEPEFNRVLNSGKTALKTLSGDFTVSDGVVRMMDLTMKTANTTANPTQLIWDLSKRTLDVSIPVVLDPLNTLPPFVLGVSVVGGRATYKPNYTDLSAVLSNQSQTALANDLRQKEEAVQMEIAQKRTDRIIQSRELTIDARNALTQMEQKIQEYPFEKGKRILQSARDAMSLVNQFAVREEPTDAQLIQQIEQARLVLLKAEEFQTSLEQETLFNIQKQMEAYKAKSEQMVAQLRAWAEGYPDIVLLGKLAENADKNNAIIQQLALSLKPDTDKETVNKILAATDEALEKITKAYQHAARFDLPLVPKTGIDAISENINQENPSPKTVKGSFKRSN